MARHLTVEPEDDFCTQALKDVLFGQALRNGSIQLCLPGHKLNHKGEGKGVLRGGNLSVFYGLRGTPYDIPAEGTILFIEDVGERPHAVERMMYNLKLGGVLDKLSGSSSDNSPNTRRTSPWEKTYMAHCRFGEGIRLPDMFRFSRRTCQHERTVDKRCCGNIGSWKERSETKF